jgi:hypothetical protein
MPPGFHRLHRDDLPRPAIEKIEEVRMSYRNDHDAALARIAALEDELEQVRKATPPVPTPAPVRRRWGRVMLGIGSAAFALATVTMVTVAVVPRHKRAEVPSMSAPAPAMQVDVATLRACRNAITHVSGLDARTTDPHAETPRSVGELDAVGARCRAELAAAAAGDARYGVWLNAEDELAGDISRIQVYYASDPYRLDGYSTAAQLWHEYERDVTWRDAALPSVDRALEITHPQS